MQYEADDHQQANTPLYSTHNMLKTCPISFQDVLKTATEAQIKYNIISLHVT